jgi:hypothetical protein
LRNTKTDVSSTGKVFIINTVQHIIIIFKNHRFACMHKQCCDAAATFITAPFGARFPETIAMVGAG